LDQEEELLFLNRRHGDVGQGDDCGAARTVVDQRHLAENAVLAESFEATIVAPDLDLSAHDDKELVASIAFAEDRVSFREIASRDLRPHEKTEIDNVVRHFASPSAWVRRIDGADLGCKFERRASTDDRRAPIKPCSIASE